MTAILISFPTVVNIILHGDKKRKVGQMENFE